MTVDGISQPGANPATGFTVANISPGGSRAVTFQVRVTSTPSGGTIANRGNVTANFVVIPNQPPITINRQTNTVVTQVNTGGLNVIKEVNTTQVAVGGHFNVHNCRSKYRKRFVNKCIFPRRYFFRCFICCKFCNN